jgi:hypothetical protein
MEDLLIVILQALGEILLELFAWGPWDSLWWWFGDYRWDGQYGPSRTTAAIVTSLAIGAVLGWLSLFLFPAVLIKWAWLRITLLFVSPAASGLMSFHFAQRRQKQFEYLDPAFHFWIGLCFSIGFVWVRFALAHRPR